MAAVSPVVLLVGYLMLFILLVGLITSFVKSKFFHYKDMECLLGAFIMVVFIVLFSAVFYIGQAISFDVNASSEILIRVMGTIVAVLLAIDAYKTVGQAE
jgi:hypothetical protein